MTKAKTRKDIYEKRGGLETNIVILTKQARIYSEAPNEQLILCNRHYKMREMSLDRDYTMRIEFSLIPEIWCNDCFQENLNHPLGDYNHNNGNN